MHISDFLSSHPDDEGSPNEIIPIAFMLQEIERKSRISRPSTILGRKSR